MIEDALPSKRTRPWANTIVFIIFLTACEGQVRSESQHDSGGESAPKSAQSTLPKSTATSASEEPDIQLLEALPLDPAPNPRRVILASLEASPNKVIEMKRCFGAALGEPDLPNCNLSNDPEIRGWINGVKRGMSKIDYFLQKAPDLRANVSLDVGIFAHGYADGNPYNPRSPHAPALLALHADLSQTYEQHLPAEARKNIDNVLAHTRALTMFEKAGIRALVEALNAWGGPKRIALDARGTVLPQRGPDFRGATISATMRISVADPAAEAVMIHSLEEEGWKTLLVSGQEEPEAKK